MKVSDGPAENLVVYNPVVGYSVNVCDEVDMFIESPWKPFLDAGIVPDYTKLPTAPVGTEMDMYYGWRETCPLHYKSSCGDVNSVRDILRGHVNVNQQDWNSWSALHYASWQGHVPVVKLLLSQNDIQPNLPSDLGYTPLHFACGRGHHEVVKVLLDVPDIDYNAKDKSSRSPLDLCVVEGANDGSVESNLNLCSRYVKEFSEREPMSINVVMPDGSDRKVVLEAGSNTTTGQILAQLELTSQTSLMFALSLVSDALSIQLREEIKPLSVLKNWSKFFDGQSASTYTPPSTPILTLTRDIRVTRERRTQFKMNPSVLTTSFTRLRGIT